MRFDLEAVQRAIEKHEPQGAHGDNTITKTAIVAPFSGYDLARATTEPTNPERKGQSKDA